MTTLTRYRLRDARRDHPLWFSDGAMGFFKSRLHDEHPTPTALYLVQETRYDEGHPKLWSVARFSPANCDTVGLPGDGLGSKKRANRIARSLASLEEHGQLREREGAQQEFRPCPHCVADGKEYPSWATYEVRYPLRLSMPVEQWLDICTDHLARLAEAHKGINS